MAVKYYLDDKGKKVYYNDDSMSNLMGGALGAILQDPLLGLLLTHSMDRQREEDANLPFADETDPETGVWTGDVGGEFPQQSHMGTPDYRTPEELELNYQRNQGLTPEEAAQSQTSMAQSRMAREGGAGVQIANINARSKMAVEAEKTERAVMIQNMRADLQKTLADWEATLQKTLQENEFRNQGELNDAQYDALDSRARAAAKAEFRSKQLRSYGGRTLYPSGEELRQGEADIDTYFDAIKIRRKFSKETGATVPPPANPASIQTPTGPNPNPNPLPPGQKLIGMANEFRALHPNGIGMAEVQKLQGTASYKALTPEEKTQLLLLIGVDPVKVFGNAGIVSGNEQLQPTSKK